MIVCCRKFIVVGGGNVCAEADVRCRRMYLVTVCLAYCTTGVAYLLSQVNIPIYFI